MISSAGTKGPQQRVWNGTQALAVVLALTACSAEDPEAWMNDLMINGRVRVVDDMLFVDQICVRPAHRHVRGIRLYVLLEDPADPAGAETVLSLEFMSSRPKTPLLCVGPARVSGVQPSGNKRIVARLDAVIDGASYAGDPVTIK